MNPGGSVKDRAAKAMIEEAEKDGRIEVGSVLIESSSGNTGIAMAMIAKIKGYHLKVVLPENVSIERRQLLEVFGAEIISSPGEEGSNGAVRRAQQHPDPHPPRPFLSPHAHQAKTPPPPQTTRPGSPRDGTPHTHLPAR